MAQYSSLRRAQLDVQYLHTNSTTHEFLFGALAELVDNSRDAGATRIDVFTENCKSVRGEKILCVQDNGEGMSPDDSAKVIQFGYSGKRARDSHSIGQYGNGLKSGAMRIGKDFILFTKRDNASTCVFLSRSFHEAEGINEVVVPLPSWSTTTKMPLAPTAEDQHKHEIEVDIIKRFSPFKSLSDIMAQFDKIKTPSGTLVMIFNLRLGDSGHTELDFNHSPDDIVMDAHDPLYYESETSVKPERRSFRAYSAVLYYDPRMKIFIQNVKVRTQRLVDSLYAPKKYHFTSKRFKTRMEAEVKKAKYAMQQAEEQAREAESNARDAEIKFGRSNQGRVKIRTAQDAAKRANDDARSKAQLVQTLEKSLKEPKTLDFIFGLNIGNRSQDGLFVYNCSRLIKMYEKVGIQADGNRDLVGVVGIVDVPYLVLEPTHNKQDFADAKEYRHLLKAMGDHLAQYWRDNFDASSKKLQDTWNSFGYPLPDTVIPLMDIKYIRKRRMNLKEWVQCDQCGKWREIPYSIQERDVVFPSDWRCSMNRDADRKRCDIPEQKRDIPIGQLQRQTLVPDRHNERVADKDSERRARKPNDIQIEGPSGRKKVSRTSSVSSTPPTTPGSVLPSIVPQRSAATAASRKIRSGQLSGRGSAPSARDSDFIDDDDLPAFRITSSKRPLIDDDSHDEYELPAKRRSTPLSQTAPRSTSRTTQASPATSPLSPDVASASHGFPTSQVSTGASARPEEPAPLQCDAYPLHCRVEARINNEWYLATVVKYSLGKENRDLRIKVKFDQNEDDKFDKHFSVNSPDLRRYRSPAANGVSDDHAPMDIDKPPAAVGRGEPSYDNLTKTLAFNFRSALQYFLPPTWHMSRDTIGELSLQELADFDSTGFFDHYESYLNTLVESFKKDSAREKEDSETKLLNLRRNVAKLLRSIRENQGEEDSGNTEEINEQTVDNVLESVVHAASENM